MISYNLVFSKYAPSTRNCVWAKPVGDDRFTLFIADACQWKPLKIVDTEDNPILTDAPEVNVDNIKEEVKTDIVGTQEDKFNAANPFTLWALKDYIDSIIEANELVNPNVKTPKKSKK